MNAKEKAAGELEVLKDMLETLILQMRSKHNPIMQEDAYKKLYYIRRQMGHITRELQERMEYDA